MNPRRRPRSAHDQLLFLIDTAYDHKSWHGTNLRGSIRGVTLRQAAWRPAANRHNVWELVVHAAYWKYVAWRRLTGAKRGSFPAGGSNFQSRPQDATDKAWRADIALLDQMHRTLRAAVATRTPTDADLALLTGVAAHDLYHAGQIQLLKRLQS